MDELRSHILNIQDLNLQIDNRNLLNSISFSISKGERVGITGPSGCGKSTLVKSIVEKKTPKGSTFRDFIIQTNSLSYMPQKNGLFPWFTIRRNIEIAFQYSGIPASFISKHITNMLVKFGIQHISDSFPNQVSGGEYQRAIIACSLSCSPELLLSDEPFTGLDNKTKWSALEHLSDILDSDQVSLLLVSHDVETLVYMCDRVIVFGGEKIQLNLIWIYVANHIKKVGRYCLVATLKLETLF